MNIIVVIPAYNEESRIKQAIRDVLPFAHEIVVVDDCSEDQTRRVALNCGVYVLRHVLNRGQGAALQTGVDFALQSLDPDLIVHFDADGQMQAKDIHHMVDCMHNNKADIVLGSRFLTDTDMPFIRRLVLRLGTLFTFIVSGIKLTDTHCGFRLLSKKAAQNISISRDRMAHASEIIDLIKVNQLRFVECPVDILYSKETLQKGQSSWAAFTIVKDLLKSKFFDV